MVPVCVFFKTRTEVSGTLSPAADRPPPSDGHERLSRATPRSQSHFDRLGLLTRGGRCTPQLTGKDAPLRLLQPTRKARAPCRIVRRSGWRARLRGRGTLVGEKSPANSPSHEVFDDTPRASVVELHARHASACEDRARVDPAGPRSRDPRPAPPSVRRCLPRAGRAPLPLTPCRRCIGTEVPIHRWTRPTPRARQGPRIERARAPSIDECPLDPPLTRGTSNADPPPVRRVLPPWPGFRRSFAASSPSFGGVRS